MLHMYPYIRLLFSRKRNARKSGLESIVLMFREISTENNVGTTRPAIFAFRRGRTWNRPVHTFVLDSPVVGVGGWGWGGGSDVTLTCMP